VSSYVKFSRQRLQIFRRAARQAAPFVTSPKAGFRDNALEVYGVVIHDAMLLDEPAMERLGAKIGPSVEDNYDNRLTDPACQFP